MHLPCGSGTELGFAGNTVTGGRDWAGVWKGAEGVVCAGGIAGADNERSGTLEHPFEKEFGANENLKRKSPCALKGFDVVIIM